LAHFAARNAAGFYGREFIEPSERSGCNGCAGGFRLEPKIREQTDMTKPIVHSVKFNASARELYGLYVDPRRHAAFTGGGRVKISSKPGSPFSAFDRMLTGRTLVAEPGKLIVQRWRSMNFHKTDPDSILVISFSQEGKQGRIDLVHINVPAQDHVGVKNGWTTYYWKPLAKYLRARRR
jgi:activator of HSP90 ATPase